MKTLHPGVHGGILFKRDEEQHKAAINEHKISPIDVVVVNLYPFRQTVTASQAPSYETAVENIDIGKAQFTLLPLACLPPTQACASMPLPGLMSAIAHMGM